MHTASTTTCVVEDDDDENETPYSKHFHHSQRTRRNSSNNNIQQYKAPPPSYRVHMQQKQQEQQKQQQQQQQKQQQKSELTVPVPSTITKKSERQEKCKSTNETRLKELYSNTIDRFRRRRASTLDTASINRVARSRDNLDVIDESKTHGKYTPRKNSGKFILCHIL